VVDVAARATQELTRGSALRLVMNTLLCRRL